jgi:hypothetical protein
LEDFKIANLPDPKRVENTEIPLAPFYSPSLTLTDYALINGNNIIKVAIVVELANQEKAALQDLRRSTERLLRDWDKKIPFLVEQQQAVRDLKGDVSSKMASLEQKGRTDSHSRQAESLLEKQVMPLHAEPGAQSA